VGSVSKKGEVNRNGPIDPVSMALALGATFVARSFSGDKKQLVPILKAGLSHTGFAFVDVISPCVTFNDHKGSTKSYAHTRTHAYEVVETDFVPLRREITTDYGHGDVRAVTMHDGSVVRFHKVAEDYDPTDRGAALEHIAEVRKRGEVPTGLLYLEENGADMHGFENTVEKPLVELPYEELCPGSAALAELQKEWW
jgi:2-oxoglutarate ferredoxin oxidoreductase subunit beta